MSTRRTFERFVSAVPVAVAFLGIAGTFLAANVVARRDAAQRSAHAQSEARHIAGQLRAGVLQAVDPLRRIAAWWLLQGRPLTPEDWDNDAQLFVSARAGLRMVAWIDPAGKRSWSVRPGTVPHVQDQEVADPILDRTVSAARQWDSMVLSEIFNGGLYACTPVKRNGRTVGYMAGLYDPAELIHSILQDQFPERYSVTITASGRRFAMPAGARPVVAGQTAPVYLPNETWQVAVAPWPGAAPTLDQSVMGFGILASVLLYISAAMARISRRRAREVAQLNRELRRNLDEFQTLLDVLPIGIAVAEDPGCRKIWTNRALAAMLNPAAEKSRIPRAGTDYELPPHKLVRNGVEVPAPELPMQVAARTRSQVSNNYLDIVRDDGTVLHTLSYAAPLFDENGNVRGVIDACVDVTERKALEERVQRAEKYASLALMAGGIAHDFNNLLTVIIGRASALAMQFPEQSATGRAIADLQTCAQKAAELVAQLLAFTGRGWRDTRPLDLSAEVESLKKEIAGIVQPTTTVRYELAAGLAPVEAAIAELRQVVQSLVANAVESLAKDGDGEIAIRTSACELAARDLDVFYPDQQLAPGAYVRLEVADNGCGIPEEIMPRIFDPFFTTKFVGRGLGLSAVQGIVRAHSGGVRIESSLHHGTRVEVVFPQVSQSAAPAPSRGALGARLRSEPRA